MNKGSGRHRTVAAEQPRTDHRSLPINLKGDSIMKHELQTRNQNYDLFDVFDDFFKPMFFEETKELRTDIKETENSYELDLELPGYGKDEIKVSLEKGYLTVSAEKHQKEEDGKKYLRREILESTSRSYYVGQDVTKEEIKAKYANGILSLTLPKASPKKTEENSYIAIE